MYQETYISISKVQALKESAPVFAKIPQAVPGKIPQTIPKPV
ncbi:hypothetical protein [Anabaena cylindrica]|nr:hypothetical protein [Anabaena cylindrica]